MRKWFVIGTFIGGFVFGGSLIAAEPAVATATATAQPTTTATATAQPTTTATAAVPAQKAEAQYKSLSNPVACFGRGIINISTCWLEIPRCFVYDNAAIPFFGLIVFIPDGAFFTVTRVLAGVGDIITLGFIGDVYTERYPDFVWESHWLPPKKNKE